MERLLKSAKFWTAVVDLVAGVALYFGAKYAGQSVADDIKFIVAAVQPVFALVIATFAWEDVAKAKALAAPAA